MTVIDLDDMCGDCKWAGHGKCLECLRTAIHDMVYGNDWSIVIDYYEEEDENDNEKDQSSA